MYANSSVESGQLHLLESIDWFVDTTGLLRVSSLRNLVAKV